MELLTDNFTDAQHTAIRVAVRIVKRNGDPVIEFGEFTDLISYNDTLSVGSFGTFSLTMRVNLTNESLLKKLHPGLVLEFYAARNDDPLAGLSEEDRERGLAPRTDNPAIFGPGDNSALKPDHQDFPTDTKVHTLIKAAEQIDTTPGELDYLDKAPYLLMRGIITQYGRSSSVGGGHAETTLVVSGEGYGKIYRDAIVHFNLKGPNLIAQTFPQQIPLVGLDAGKKLYYGLLRHWVEEFWGDPTGWEARSRPVLFPPWVYARFQSGGQVWGLINALNVPELFALFVDHTGAIVWSKQPWSSKEKSLIDPYLKTWISEDLLTNWEDLTLFKLQSWKILSWSDRLTDDQMANFVRAQKTAYAGVGGVTELPSEAYNMGSIAQYGGPRIRQIEFPWGTQAINKEDQETKEQQKTEVNEVADALAQEYLRWVDRPIQRVALQARGEPYWRIHTRLQLKEDWHSPQAPEAEYYVAGRSHQISFQRSGWVTSLDLIRDRRERYLGQGVEQEDISNFVQADDIRVFTRGSQSFVRSSPDASITQPFSGLTGGAPIQVPAPDVLPTPPPIPIPVPPPEN